MVKKAQQAAKEFGGDGTDAWSVRAMMAQLNKQWPVSESLLLAQGKVDDAITLYQDNHRWEDAIRVADSTHHANAAALKQQYLTWLLETGQEEQAGAVKEREGDYLAAIGLYLKGGLPGRAAQVRVCVFVCVYMLLGLGVAPCRSGGCGSAGYLRAGVSPCLVSASGPVPTVSTQHARQPSKRRTSPRGGWYPPNSRASSAVLFPRWSCRCTT